MRSLLLVLAMGLVAAGAATRRSGYPATMPAGEVETIKYDWTDQARNRAVPVKIYFPKTGGGPFPVIIFSHGLGGSRDGYEYLGRYWASHGYISVHVQHLGSDTQVWKDSKEPLRDMTKAAADPNNALQRPLDVTFAIDQVIALNTADGPLKGRIDVKKVGVAGHSFGAFTAMASAGQTLIGVLGRERTLGDPRIMAAIAMSTPAPLLKDKDRLDKFYGSIKVPVMHLTGTKDDSPIGEGRAADRRLAFDHITGVDQYLVTFIGGDHMVFSGRFRGTGGGVLEDLNGMRGDVGTDAVFQDLVKHATLAFWDAYLKGDLKAKEWLGHGGLKETLGENGMLETKAAPR